MSKQDANWLTINPATLAEDDQRRHADYKAAYAMMKEAKAKFEDAMQVNAPDGQRLIFGYNFGKLSIALVADERKPVKGVLSLADFLQTQVANGDRA